MNQPSKFRRVNVAAILVAAVGILLIFVSARDLFPVIPPGPIILAVAAAVVAFAPGRWPPVVGVVVPLFITVGGFLSGGLSDALGENAGTILGITIEMVALVTAMVAGVMATVVPQRTGAVR